ncbi:hypothetical protein FTUN_0791 [Frigoriglobus tundricola]|uniref:Uncharacterized protein n=1 Tax=Frigoriglobus tundricola TaxID=2774151 RepID=A0A6M5YGX3_9BACT|nr:hypothetical protein FTUN_0791 [Frigoriglobus tundricola]
MGKIRTNHFTLVLGLRYALTNSLYRSPMFAPLTSLVRGWRAAWLLVVLACAKPGRAAAECGDHVTILNTQVNPTDATASSPSGTPAPLNAPCSGPNCSRLPDRHPPLAPAPVSEPSGKEAAAILGLLGAPDLARFALAPAATSHRPIARATAIFHPPRAV